MEEREEREGDREGERTREGKREGERLREIESTPSIYASFYSNPCGRMGCSGRAGSHWGMRTERENEGEDTRAKERESTAVLTLR